MSVLANPHPHLLAKSRENGGTTLYDHLLHVAAAAEVFARYARLDVPTARLGALLHDIGKASPVFQERLTKRRSSRGEQPFRHELASLLFLPLVPHAQRTPVLEMVVAHHKSMHQDAGELGLLDLDNYDEEAVLFHLDRWDEWAPAALALLAALGVAGVRPLPRAEAEAALRQAVADCWALVTTHHYGASAWKGLLVGADHYASALLDDTAATMAQAFKKPDLSCFERPDRTGLYPLANYPADSGRPHTLVTAPTGAGKTDYLLRRCRGRVFYVLPFQASINAMHRRLQKELEPVGADVRLLHAASRVRPETDLRGKLTWAEKALQDKVGAAVKVLTPHQLAGLAFGTRGYETLLLDVRGCDIILDEIHTYTAVSQAMVLKLVEVLSHAGCRLHVGTATMPTVLYERVAALLGREQVLEIKLTDEELRGYDRHQIHKAGDFISLLPMLRRAVAAKEKVLLVCNRVRRAQELFKELQEEFLDVPKLLLHSRFKRGQRAELERRLLDEINPEAVVGPCLVVATQVVEVSLDISFDRMVTEAAPLDALVQRFGRVNRRRTIDTRGQLKPIYVLAPPAADDPDKAASAKPYDWEVVNASYQSLPDGGAILHEHDVQALIDAVYPSVDFTDVEAHSIFQNGAWTQHLLTHRASSYLLGLLEIDSVACVLEQDKEAYRTACRTQDVGTQTQLEIPLSFKPFIMNKMERLDYGNRPFVVADAAYSDALGLQTEKITVQTGPLFEIW
ncbi:CRISPR-associated helicase Cas3' [Hymenobacter psoromatis]|uniref:CRISPR-associated helicase Cas3' n=1 Tax=Hymenobacter psoromatis TaxID=1484116 RepID=UPI001CBE698C|nr:CRISPR-associated helicase Cas3' [Hymenobacter psoromatis]